METHQLINQTSTEVEYYTPLPIVDAARRTMGRIGLDPASSAIANKRVKADAWFGIPDRSLERAWCDEVWLNWPFGRPETACETPCLRKTKNPRHKCHSFDLFGNKAWCQKLIHEFGIGNIPQACCITYACTSEDWFQPLMIYPQCFLTPRTNYYLPDGSLLKGVSKGSVVTYLGPNVARFAREFERFGTIKIRYPGSSD
jgi:hypothetical protein